MACPHEEEKRWWRLLALLMLAVKDESSVGSHGTMEYEHLVENELFTAAVWEVFTDVMWTRCPDVLHICVLLVDDYSDGFSERKLCGCYWKRKPEVSHRNSVSMSMDSADLPPCFLFRRTSFLGSWMDKRREPALPMEAVERERPVDRQWQWIVGVQKPPDRGRHSLGLMDRMQPGKRLVDCLDWIVCRWRWRGRKRILPTVVPGPKMVFVWKTKIVIRLCEWIGGDMRGAIWLCVAGCGEDESLPFSLLEALVHVAVTKKVFDWSRRQGVWTWPLDGSSKFLLL
jgi:hypothetical protein